MKIREALVYLFWFIVFYLTLILIFYKPAKAQVIQEENRNYLCSKGAK